MKYLATSASGVFEGVEQTRALLLTRDYLLDVFHASSDLPHSYDYLLHSLCEARPTSGAYQPAPEAMPRYWVIDQKQQMATDEAWSIGFTSRDEPGSRGGNFGPEWYGHTAHVRVSMAAAPGTQLEASGNVDLGTVAQVAATGVDRISVGALTHSATALDIGLDWLY